jgi:hypothetical protein
MISKKQMDVAQERYDAMIPEFDDSDDYDDDDDYDDEFDDEFDDDYDVDVCLNCGRILLGDGYVEVKHCEFAAEEDYINCAPYDGPIYCKGD